MAELYGVNYPYGVTIRKPPEGHDPSDYWWRAELRTYCSADEWGDPGPSYTVLELNCHRVEKVTPKGGETFRPGLRSWHSYPAIRCAYPRAGSSGRSCPEGPSCEDVPAPIEESREGVERPSESPRPLHRGCGELFLLYLNLGVSKSSGI